MSDTDRPTLKRIDTGKVADVVVRGLAEFRDRNPEGWEDFLALVDTQGGLFYELSLMDDGTVEVHMGAVPIARVPFALVEPHDAWPAATVDPVTPVEKSLVQPTPPGPASTTLRHGAGTKIAGKVFASCRVQTVTLPEAGF